MAKKIKFRLWLSLFIVMMAGVALAFLWQGKNYSLPDIPTPIGPAELKTKLESAYRRAKSVRRNQALEGIAELGQLFHANGFNREAKSCWEILEKKFPADARWCYYLADLGRMTADNDTLRHWLEETVRRDPMYSPAWLELAELEFKTGLLDEAERAYRRRLKLTAGDPYATLGLARLLLQKGKRAEGRQLLEQLVKTVPDFPSAHNVYAELLEREGASEEAAHHRWLGTVSGRFRPAEDPWKEELRIHCYKTDQLILWGLVELHTKHGDKGKFFFERARLLEPGDPRSYEHLGALYLESGDYAAAREILQQGNKLPGASVALTTSLCDAYRAQKLPLNALRAAEEKLIENPESSDLQNARGLALNDARRPNEAVEAFKAAAALQPSAANPIANMALSYLQLGKRDAAETLLRRALELQPMFPRAVITLARLEIESGHLQSAASYILPYFKQYPGAAPARELVTLLHLRAAVDLSKNGEVIEAEKMCHDGLALIPESAELQQLLNSISSQKQRAAVVQ